MEIEEWIKNSEANISKLLSDYCIVNNEFLRLDDISKWGYQDFINYVQKRIPDKLYKYFPNTVDQNNVNYSLEALVDNCVYLSYPRVFDDIYDSDITISFDVFERLRMIEYCKRAVVFTDESMSTQDIRKLFISHIEGYYDGKKINRDSYKDFIKMFRLKNLTEIEYIADELFCRRLCFELENPSMTVSKALYNVLKTEYYKCLDNLKNTFKTTCFATTPYSQLMWGGTYANCHKGFCIEYTVSKDIDFKGIYENLFPLVYSKVRSNIETEFINQLDAFPSMDTLKNIYIHGALRKSLDWSFQNEWRLLLLDGMPEMEESKVLFFPISKVYLGYRISEEDKEKIIMICRAKGIEYAGVRKRHDIFEMEECSID